MTDPDHRAPLRRGSPADQHRRAAALIGARGHRRSRRPDHRPGQERMAVSAVIQQARITSGGRRVNLSREMEILGHYSDALGKPGTALAMTLLELCRGRV